MQDLVTFFVGRFGEFITWLSGRSILSGLSLLGFFGAIIIISLFIRSFLLTSR